MFKGIYKEILARLLYSKRAILAGALDFKRNYKGLLARLLYFQRESWIVSFVKTRNS